MPEPAEDAEVIGPLPTVNPVQPRAVTTGSRRGVVVGLILAFAIPVSYWVLATLVEHGIAPYDQTHALLGTLSLIALAEALLGPIGMGIALWSAGVRGPFALAALIIVTVPVLAIVWFLCVATLSGALGNPF